MVSHGGSLDTEIRVVADKALSEQQISLTNNRDGWQCHCGVWKKSNTIGNPHVLALIYHLTHEQWYSLIINTSRSMALMPVFPVGLGKDIKLECETSALQCGRSEFEETAPWSHPHFGWHTSQWEVLFPPSNKWFPEEQVTKEVFHPLPPSLYAWSNAVSGLELSVINVCSQAATAGKGDSSIREHLGEKLVITKKGSTFDQWPWPMHRVLTNGTISL